MKKAATFLSVFLLTLLIGYFAVPNLIRKIETPTVENLAENEVPIVQTVQNENNIEGDEAEIIWEENIDRKFKIKLLETGSFHGEEARAKSGETWLGLFKEGNKYFLRNTKIKVSRFADGSLEEKENRKTGKEVTVNRKNPNIFLLKNAPNLTTGEVKTLLDKSQDEPPFNMSNGFSQDYYFKGQQYTLQIENNVSKSENLTTDSKLILSKGKTRQVLATLRDGCDDCFWNISWVGDLDQDGKLDFYLDLSNHYNVSAKTLFLSSLAEKNKLVKKTALFRTVGC